MINFKTEVVVIDDCESFLSSLRSFFKNSDLKVRYFSSLRLAEEYINTSSENIRALQEGLKNIRLDENRCELSIEYIKSLRIVSCIISDYQMLEENGVDFLSRLHTKSKKALLTGVADQEIAVNAFNDGAIDYYLKKDDINLPSKITNVISKLSNSFMVDTFFDENSELDKHVFQELEGVGVEYFYPTVYDGEYSFETHGGNVGYVYLYSKKDFDVYFNYCVNTGLDEKIIQKIKEDRIIIPHELIEASKKDSKGLLKKSISMNKIDGYDLYYGFFS